MRHHPTALLASLLALLAVACASPSADTGNIDPGGATGSSSPTTGGSNDDAGFNGAGQGNAPPSGGSSFDDAGAPSAPGTDASTPPTKGSDAGSPKTGGDAGHGSSDDAGAPTSPPRNSSCVPESQQTGTAVDTTHGRLDGTLVYVLPIDGSSTCNGDDAHVHLQIELNGSVYDVAVDVGKSGDEVGWYEKSLAFPGGTWSEGWHGSDDLGYSSLGLSSGSFTTLDPDAMAAKVESLLENTSKISIYCTGYTPQDNGCHDVHYQDGTSQDGAIVLDPTSATSQVVFFRFTDETF